MPFANREPASELCLLSGLAHKKPGTKVRFLGCVESYDDATAVLTLAEPTAGTPTKVKALVSLVAIFDRITDAHVSKNAWVNVMGRIGVGQRIAQRDLKGDVHVHVEALLVWASGALDYQAYEKEVAALVRESSLDA